MDVHGSGSERRRQCVELAVSAQRGGWRHGLSPNRDGRAPGLDCIGGEVDLLQTHTILICA